MSNTPQRPCLSTTRDTQKQLTTVLETHTGTASFYGKGDGLAGNRMANGERMHPDSLTAAHRTRPFGTQVRVIHENTQTKTADTVIVEITDRGPFTKNAKGNYNRLIDVSYEAAKQLHMLQKGHAQITAQVLERGKPSKKKTKKQRRK